jgi:coiled-coil domain-containing protein 130
VGRLGKALNKCRHYLVDDGEADLLATNAFYRLEHDFQDKKKAEEVVPIITKLQRLSDQAWCDPFTNSQKIRKRFRVRV